jgi:hypothetical protein
MVSVPSQVVKSKPSRRGIPKRLMFSLLEILVRKHSAAELDLYGWRPRLKMAY